MSLALDPTLLIRAEMGQAIYTILVRRAYKLLEVGLLMEVEIGFYPYSAKEGFLFLFFVEDSQ